MIQTQWRYSGILAVVLALAMPAALADKHEHKGGKGGKHAHKEQGGGHAKKKKAASHGDAKVEVHFGDQQRVVIRDYYAQEFKAGSCPPGLAKKKNGCQPPGQAKKWQKGRPLPSDVIYYDLPPRVSVELGTPPAGHKFVRVASDILMIAIGSGMVVDAIEDLGRL